jgi:large subunit ribosomal protein L25
MSDVLNVENRSRVGTAATRRLRRQGRVPVVLYGHGEGTAHLSVPSVQIKSLLRHHGKTVTLEGDVRDTALVRDIQFDPMGIEVLHLDLLRVNLKELVQVTVPIHRHGDPVGLREGGVLLENLHSVEIRCPAGQIPEFVQLEVSGVHVGGHCTASQLQLPEGVELVTSPDTVVMHIEQPRDHDQGATELSGLEPELIARAKPEEGQV